MRGLRVCGSANRFLRPRSRAPDPDRCVWSSCRLDLPGAGEHLGSALEWRSRRLHTRTRYPKRSFCWLHLRLPRELPGHLFRPARHLREAGDSRQQRCAEVDEERIVHGAGKYGNTLVRVGVCARRVKVRILHRTRARVGWNGVKRRAIFIHDGSGHPVIDHRDRVGLAQIQAWIVEVRDLGRNAGSGAARSRGESRQGRGIVGS